MSRRKPARRQKSRGPSPAVRALLALGVVFGVLGAVAGGLWAMTPKETPTAVAQSTSTPTLTPTPRPTSTATAVPSPTPLPETPTVTPTPTPAAEPFTLTLLHTNDTWGYTQPCG